LGYVCEGRLLNTVHYGVPQNSKRVIILGFIKMLSVHIKLRNFPTPTTLDESQQVSAFEAIADLEHVIPNEFIEKPSTTNRYLDQINKY
jgi:site-specific DNA-cytosine methylase